MAQYALSFLFARGVVNLTRGRWEANEVYHRLKDDLVLAHGLAFLFWFGFYALIAGEWFEASENTNSTKAMLFAVSNLLNIVILYLADEEGHEKISDSDLIS